MRSADGLASNASSFSRLRSTPTSLPTSSAAYAGLDVRIGILPHLVDVLGSSVEVDDVEGITVLGMASPTLSRSSRALKRAMDV